MGITCCDAFAPAQLQAQRFNTLPAMCALCLQACQEEADAQHRGAAAELASRVEQLEELLQRQLADR